MRVTDEHMEAVRASLTDVDEFERRFARLESSRDLEGYKGALVSVLFEFAHRRFAGPDRMAEVVRWVAAMRVQWDDPELDLDLHPVAAEQLFHMLFGEPSIYPEFSETVREQTQTWLLLLLYVDLDLSDAALDDLLAQARDRATQIPV